MTMKKVGKRKRTITAAQRSAQQAKIIQQLIALQASASAMMKKAQELGVHVRVAPRPGLPVAFIMSATPISNRRSCGCSVDVDCDCDDDGV